MDFTANDGERKAATLNLVTDGGTLQVPLLGHNPTQFSELRYQPEVDLSAAGGQTATYPETFYNTGTSIPLNPAYPPFTSLTITGPDASDFSVQAPVWSSGNAVGSATILFTPSHTGPESATLSGNGVTVALRGNGQ